MIDFEHVTKQYKHGEKPALEDINFHVDDGEFVFLLGHSGAGKSTLLKLILREERATSGQVLVDGKDVAKLRRHKIPYLRRQMGIIFQDFRLIPTMTVYENIAFAMHVTNIGRKQIKERVPYMLELVHLEDKANVYPEFLSGGEQLAYYPWPQYEEAKCVEATVEIAVQVNGKVKARLKVAADITSEDAIAAAKAEPAVAEVLAGKTIVKEIYVKGRLVNLAAKG